MAASDSSGLSSPLSSAPSTLELEVPSSPLSTLSRSPSPPPTFRLFTPPPSQDAGEDMPRPRKRRKVERPDRTTRYLDLTDSTAQSLYDRNDSVELLMHALRKRQKIVVFAGAGISVSAGIPDFRSANGLFAGLQKEHRLKGGSGKQLFDASVYKDATATSQFHDMVRKLSKMSKRAQPTKFHHMLARLASEGRLLRLYTQNVDGLETQIPPLRTAVPLPHKGPWPQTVQLHGGLEKMMCQKCREIMDFDPVLFDGSETPTCPKCREMDQFRTNDLGRRSHGIGRLRPRIVLYGEQNPDEEAIGAVSTADCRTRPDAIVVVGTSMKIPGVRRLVSEMCKIVRDRREGTTIWVNPDPEPSGPLFEDCWDLIVKGGSDEVAKIARLKEWDDPNMDDLDVPTEYTDEHLEDVRARQGEIRISLPPSPNKKPAMGAVMTPPRSQCGDADTPAKQKSSPFRIKLNVGEKSAEAEKKQHSSSTVQVNIPPLAKTKNPASSGKRLADVLGKKNVEQNRKPKTTRKKKEKSGTTQSQQTKLGEKVTKSAALHGHPQALLPAKKRHASETNQARGSYTFKANLQSHAPVSAHQPHPQQQPHTDQRHNSVSMSNGKLGTFQVFHQYDAKQDATPDMTSGSTTPGDTPAPQTPPTTSQSFENGKGSPLTYDRKETVSPKSVPRGMQDLLCA